MNKRGQGLSVNAIILIILGVVVLVVLIAGFTLGWGSLRDYISPTNNLARIQSECSTLCTINDGYSYCVEEKTVRIENQENILGTCAELVEETDANGNSLGIESCSQINCGDYLNSENQNGES